MFKLSIFAISFILLSGNSYAQYYDNYSDSYRDGYRRGHAETNDYNSNSRSLLGGSNTTGQPLLGRDTSPSGIPKSYGADSYDDYRDGYRRGRATGSNRNRAGSSLLGN